MPARKYEGTYAERKRQAGRTRRLKDPAKHREVAFKAQRQWKQKNIARALLNGMRGRAARKDFECTITLEEMTALLEPMTCALTGWPLRWDADAIRDPMAPSPDQIVPRLGYVSGNVRIVCWRANEMRKNMTDAELFDTIEAMLAHRKGHHS